MGQQLPLGEGPIGLRMPEVGIGMNAVSVSATGQSSGGRPFMASCAAWRSQAWYVRVLPTL